MPAADTLEELFAQVATERCWWTVVHPVYKGVVTSFRSRERALEYQAEVEKRWQDSAPLTSSETLPGYD